MRRRGLEDLVEQYRETLGHVRSQVRRMQRRAQETGDERAKLDARVWESMARSVQYALDVMCGENTGTHREVPVGGWVELDRLGRRGACAAPADAWIEEADELERAHRTYVALSTMMTRREAACYVAYERGMSFGEIAEILGVTRGTVQSYVERARAKLERAESIQTALWDESPGLGA
jgi:RNA polymerase sigma-70 factor (ECF subfamily)